MPTTPTTELTQTRPQPCGPPPSEFGAELPRPRRLRLTVPRFAVHLTTRRHAAEQARQPEPIPLAPAWGWKIPDAGRAAHVSAGPEYQATTTQLCGLFPFVAGSGTPTAGTPIGRHQLWG